MGPELSVCCPKLFLYGKEDTDCCNNNADDRQNEYPRRQFVRLFNEPGNGCSSEQELVADGMCRTCYNKADLLRIAPTNLTRTIK